MFALTLTLLTAVFVLGPELISRSLIGIVVPRRNIQQTKSEEITRAALVAVLPLLVAVLWVRLSHAVVWSSVDSDVRTYFSAIVSQGFLDSHTAEFFQATKTVLRISWAIAWRLYVVLVGYFGLIDLLIIYYGEVRNLKWMRKHLFWRNVLATFVLPRISEW